MPDAETRSACVRSACEVVQVRKTHACVLPSCVGRERARPGPSQADQEGPPMAGQRAPETPRGKAVQPWRLLSRVAVARSENGERDVEAHGGLVASGPPSGASCAGPHRAHRPLACDVDSRERPIDGICACDAAERFPPSGPSCTKPRWSMHESNCHIICNHVSAKRLVVSRPRSCDHGTCVTTHDQDAGERRHT